MLIIRPPLSIFLLPHREHLSRESVERTFGLQAPSPAFLSESNPADGTVTSSLDLDEWAATSLSALFPVLSLMLIEHGRLSSGEARRFAAAACLDWKAGLLSTVSTRQNSSQQERGVNEGGRLLLCVQTVRFVCTGSLTRGELGAVTRRCHPWFESEQAACHVSKGQDGLRRPTETSPRC